MKMRTFKEKNKKINNLQLATNIIVLIIIVILGGSILPYVKAQGNEIQEVEMAIHAVEQADYNGEYFNNEYPGVKLSILREILYDQNISQEELEARIKKLEKRLNDPVPLTIGKVPEQEKPKIDFTPVVETIPSTPDPGVPTTNPSQAERTITLTHTPVLTITNIATNTRTTASITPKISPTRTSTSTITKTPTLTFTRTRTNTPTKTISLTSTPTLPFTPTRTNIPTHTFTWVPTKTYTFTPIPPTFTSTWTYTPTFTNTWTNTPTPTPTDTKTPTPTYTFTTIPPTLTFTPNPACNTTNPPITITVIFNPSEGSTDVPINIHPEVRFNQSMDPSTFVYGSKNSIALCEFDIENACPTSKIIEATILIENTVYNYDKVTILPVNPLLNGTNYTILIGTSLAPNPSCIGFSDPISTIIRSSFTTIQ
jgi:hypothetical protein